MQATYRAALHVYFLDRFIDISDVYFEFLENETLYVQGTAVWLREPGTEHVGEVFKENIISKYPISKSKNTFHSNMLKMS